MFGTLWTLGIQMGCWAFKLNAKGQVMWNQDCARRGQFANHDVPIRNVNRILGDEIALQRHSPNFLGL